MAVTYPNSVKNARMASVVSAIGASGKIKLFDAADVLLATFTLAATAGTVAGAGVLTFSDANGATAGILNTTAVAAGVASKATITTSADVDVVTGLTVGMVSADMVLDNPTFTLGQAITINAASLTHAA